MGIFKNSIDYTKYNKKTVKGNDLYKVSLLSLIYYKDKLEFLKMRPYGTLFIVNTDYKIIMNNLEEPLSQQLALYDLLQIKNANNTIYVVFLKEQLDEIYECINYKQHNNYERLNRFNDILNKNNLLHIF